MRPTTTTLRTGMAGGSSWRGTVLEVRGDQVRIGVSAPCDVDVHREEVFLELQGANRSAASPSAVEGFGQLLPSASGRPDGESPEQPSQRRPGGKE